jgi:hypothetical protein
VLSVRQSRSLMRNSATENIPAPAATEEAQGAAAKTE